MTAQPDTPSASAGDGREAGDGTEPAASEDSSPPISRDVIFELLKNQRRRYVLRYLADDPGPVRLRDLAERIAAWENDKPIGALDSDERKRVYVGLYQCHLTKMDDAGAVEFNQDRGLIALGEQAPLLYQYLDPVRGGDNSWSLGYLGLAVVSGVLALLVEAGLLGTVSQGTLTGLVVLAFSLLALIHAATASVLDVESPTAVLDALGSTLADTDRS
jgi:hypothetical protein